MNNEPQSSHSPTCAVFCLNDKRTDIHHSCWCAEGTLIYRQFGKRHPKWRTLPPEEWLTTSDGRAWHAQMQQRTPAAATSGDTR